MYYSVKVRVDIAKMAEFGAMLQGNRLDRSAIRGDTYCLREDPAVGYSVWEAEDRAAFDAIFSAWRSYYSEAEVRELIKPEEAARLLARRPGTHRESPGLISRER
jgi:hypothetical protein